MHKWLFRSATSADIGELVRLEEEIERALPSREMFAIDGPEFYEPIIAGAGHILLACDAGGIAGVSVIRFPEADDPENLGHCVSLPFPYLTNVRHLESVFLRSDCRGTRLAETVIRMNLDHTSASGRNISMATVWPMNIPSLRLHLGLGMHIRAYALKYGGKPRFILMDEGKTLSLGERFLSVPVDDLAAHARLLGSGMTGTNLIRKDGTYCIEYRSILS